MITRYLKLFISCTVLWSCARQTTPTGGPKDLIPPKLVSSNPENNQRNFSGKTLTFTFDEAIKLKDPKEEIIIAPSAGKDVNFVAKQNRVVLELKTSLKDSTTYNIAFREAIQDLTEGNPAENLRIAFSTGPIIDSLKIIGKVFNTLTEKIPEKITVALYQSDTFQIFKHTPTYFTKTNDNGSFALTNLQPGTYRIYAFADKNKDLKVDSKGEQFGFLPGKISLTQNTDSLHILLVNLDSRPLLFANVRNSDKYSRVKFNKSLVRYSASMPGSYILNTFGDDQSEIKFYSLPPSDSIPINFHVTDSLEQTLDTLVYIKAGTTNPIKDKFTTDLQQVAYDPETSLLHATLTFNKPLASIVFDSLLIKIDSLNTLTFTPQDLTYDTIFSKLDLEKQIDKKTLLELTEPNIQLFLGAHSFISIQSDSSKQITKDITIPKPEDLASLSLEVETTQKDFIIQLLTPEYKLVQAAHNTKTIIFNNLPPGQYKIRIILDANQNNRWDPGNINKDIPPETTFYFRNSDGTYQFPLRANWQVGPYTIKF